MAKYEQIYRKILNKIETREYEPGSKLPGEFELMKQFDSSRDTIRKALSLLAQNGFIQKQQGRGSIVLDLNRYDFPVSGITSFKEVAQSMREDVSTRVVCLEKIHPDSRFQEIFEMSADDYIWFIQRVRLIDREAVILDTDVLDARIITGLTKEIAEDSLYEYIENVLHINIAYAKKEITCQNINGQDEHLLDMKTFDMVVNVSSYTYLEDTRLFQYTASRHRPDKFQFVDFARRQKVL